MIAGKYVATVIEHSLGRSEQKGTHFIGVRFGVGEGEQRETIGARIWMTDESMHIARKSLSAMGFDCDKQELSALEENPILLAGNRCEIDVQEEEYKGVPQLKVKWINALPKPGAPNELAALTKKLRAAKKKRDPDDEAAVADDAKRGTGTPPVNPKTGKPYTEEELDAEVPF